MGTKKHDGVESCDAQGTVRAGKERRPAVLRNFDISYIGVCAPQIWIYCIAHRSDGALGEVALGVPLYLALSATMAVVMMLVLRGCVPSLRRLAWPLAVVQGLASVALVVPLLPASPSASIFYAVAAALAGACIGFLWFNSFPADIFMGDTGSLLLGYVLATVSVLGLFKFYAIVTFVVPVLALAVPLSDTLFAFCRRILHGQSPFHADRGHFHHKLMDLGLNQKQAVAILYAISATLGLAAVVLTTKGTIRIALLILALLIGFVVCAFIRKSVHKHHLDVELQEAKAAAEAENAAAAENTAPVQEGNDEQTH